MKLAKFTFSDGEEQYDGYTDGRLWNGWSIPYLTRDQLLEVMFPYDVRFLEAKQGWNKNDYPIAIIYMDDNDDEIKSSIITVENEDGSTVSLEVYCLEGYEFMEVE